MVMHELKRKNVENCIINSLVICVLQQS